MSKGLQLTVKGRNIRFNDDGLACLDDLWKAGGYSKNRSPHNWLRLEANKGLIEAILKRTSGKLANWTKEEQRKAHTYDRVAKLLYADVRVALAYAEFLNPVLALEVREVYLRYRGGDATLADDILDRASPEDNEWAATRAMGRAERKRFTATLQSHGVVDRGYADSTNAIYQGLFASKASDLKREKGIPAKANLRNAMSTDELIFVMAAETMARGRIEEKNINGNAACQSAALRSASFMKQAIDAEKRDRSVT
jgi:hypothetical protein